MEKSTKRIPSKRSCDEALGLSEASHRKKPKTIGESCPCISDCTLRRFPVDLSDEGGYTSPYRVFSSESDSRLDVSLANLENEIRTLRAALIWERKRRAYWQETSIKNQKSAEAWKDRAIQASGYIPVLVQKIEAQQLEIGQQNQAVPHSPPKTQSGSPAKPAPAAEPVIIDLTGDDNQPTGRLPAPSQNAQGQKRGQLRESFRTKSYSWLGERNHMKKGYVAPPIWESSVRKAREKNRQARHTSADAASAPTASRADPVEETQTFDELADELEAELQGDAS